MVEMKVSGIVLDPQSKTPIVVLRDLEERRALLIWIGTPEANAIMLVLERVRLIRPSSHDLMMNILSALRVTLQHILISDIQDNTFYAQLYVQTADGVIAIDARPSDAIALSLRAGAPIFVAEQVMMSSSIPISQERELAEQEEFRRFLENVKPSDFGRSS